MPSYVTLAEVKRYINLPSSSTDQDNDLNDIIPQVSQEIDSFCGTWFDQRSKTITTESTKAYQKRLFVPAYIQSITSITENGLQLDPTQYFVYDFYIEKLGQAPWSILQQGIVIIGSFGYWPSSKTAVPPDIVLACKEMVAVKSGLKTKSFTTDDGVEKTVFVTSYPRWVMDILNSYRLENMLGQTWMI